MRRLGTVRLDMFLVIGNLSIGCGITGCFMNEYLLRIAGLRGKHELPGFGTLGERAAGGVFVMLHIDD